MKSGRLGPFALLVAWLVVFTWLQHSTVESAQAAEVPEAAAQMSVAASDGADEPMPMASCFLTCTRACIADQCAGVPEGPELQQCSRDCAEGCSCSCGMACP